MYQTLEAAGVALKRDGWERFTPYWYRKVASGGRYIWCEIEKDSDGYNIEYRGYEDDF